MDNDGCPDNPAEGDSDFDGIPDGIDECPLDRERYNGFQDNDGCPDYPDFITSLDSDFDGIIDDYR